MRVEVRLPALSWLLVVVATLACGNIDGDKEGAIKLRPGNDGAVAIASDADLDADLNADLDASADASRDTTPDSDCPRVRVDVEPGLALNMRKEPSSSGAFAGELYEGFVVDVLERVEGEVVAEDPTWFRIKTLRAEGYVSGAFVSCTSTEVRDLRPPDGFYLPLECGRSSTITAGYNSSLHTGLNAYSLDFRVTLGQPLTAIADGFVLRVYDETKPGSDCDMGGEECTQFANYVLLMHGDGTTSTYRHLLEASVEEGDLVMRGATVGLAGQSGWATGPHSHLQRMNHCEKTFQPEGFGCQSIVTTFEDVEGGSTPTNGQSVISGNCP